MSVLLTGGVVVTGPGWVPVAADVLVDGGAIAAVGAPGSLDGGGHGERVDVSGRLLLPGLVNAHTHSHTLVARGAARDWTLEDSLLNGGWMSAARGAELAELSALLAATEMIASGATGAFDLMAQAGGPDVDGLLAAARGYARAGLRTVLAPMVADRSVHEAVPAIGECCGVPPAGSPAAEVVARCAAFADALLDEAPLGGLVTPAVAPTILAHCTPELVAGLHTVAAERGLRVHTHLAESKPQALAGAERFGRSITAELDRLGVLDDRLTVAHAIWLSDADRDLLAAAGAVAVTVPGSNLRLGSGIADARATLAAGVRLAVGTDGANSADALDVLDAARLTALLARASTRPAAEWLTVEEVLTAATEGGAAACGWDRVGRIEPGWAADLALLDLGSRAFLPATDLANQALTAARAADVTDVMVAGRWVYRDRTFPGLDVAAAESRFRELAEELLAAAAPARDAAPPWSPRSRHPADAPLPLLEPLPVAAGRVPQADHASHLTGTSCA
ncbi:amidohydrolase family protein, partial [Nocardioides sp. YIM 152588]|uniref:amidohydrolase family protein n=1 Tax=Nocardioides sp. YIM 152588 TaxID=3158259 RepID=UPI0032E499AF